MHYPKISIVTPSYNQVQFLERTILSVINQDYPNLEYIIIDGGSTDGSIEIIKKYEKHLAYWISEKDNGQSDAINKGFNNATGEIFAYLNSDDMYLPDTFKTIIDIFSKNIKADIVYGHALIINESDKVINQCIALPFLLKEHLNGVFSIPQQSSFWKRKVYDTIGGFNVKNHTCMDGEFFAFAGAQNFNFFLIDKVISKFRIHSESKTGNSSSILKKSYPKDQIKYISEIGKTFNIPVNKLLGYWFRLKYIPLKAFSKFNISRG